MQRVPSTFFHSADLHCGCWGDEAASLQQLHQNTDKTGTPDVPCCEERDALCLLRSLGKLHICHIRFKMVLLSSILLCMHTSLFYGSWIIHGLLSHSHLPVWQQGFQRWHQSSVSLAVQPVQHRGSCLQERCTHGDGACTSILTEVTSWSATGTGKEPGIGFLFTQVILLKKYIEMKSQ